MSIVIFKLYICFSTKRRFAQVIIYHTQHFEQIALYYYFPLENIADIVYNIYITHGNFAGLEITMSEMNEYTPELFELIDDEGNMKQFELIDCAEINGEQYFAMVPAVEDEDFLNGDCDIIFLKTFEENGEEILASIDDDDEFDQVSEFFLQRISDVFDQFEEDMAEEAEEK